MLPNDDIGIEMKNVILKKNSDWSEGAVGLLGKWERICTYRKKAHYVAANSFGWKNKLLSIPIILISTVLGSMSFITPSFIEGTASSGARMLTTRVLSTDAPTTLAPTPECVWERYEDDVIDEAPYCDNKIIKFNENFYKSTLSSVDELICDRSVNFVSGTAYHQFPVASGITAQADVEAWCIEYDEGYGIFYQQYWDGFLMCMVLEGEAQSPILHSHHLFGGVCVHSGEVSDISATYIKQCGDNSAVLATEDIYDGDCMQPCGGASGECPNIGGGGVAFYDCGCCYDYWLGCSFSECSDWCFPDCSPYGPSPTFNPTAMPTTATPTCPPTPFPTPTACANNCCVSGPDMWTPDASPTIPGWTLKSSYLDHTNGGIGKKNQCEDMCRADPQCNSWMWRSSAHTCYLSTDAELQEYLPNPGYNDHHPHEFRRGCTATPTFTPTKTPSKQPSKTPSKQPTKTPSKQPTKTPSKKPTPLPSPLPTPAPSAQPSYAPTKLPTPQPSATPTRISSASAEYTRAPTKSASKYTYVPYIIGAFNMIIAVLSALHAFLKYDALEDRHQQYSRHFGNLQVDLETLLAKPIEQRGSAGTAVERYKIKYAVLINNAPDLPEKLELLCCAPEDTHAIDLS